MISIGISGCWAVVHQEKSGSESLRETQRAATGVEKKSLLILVDGISGAGKGTQTRTIAEFFRGKGYHEPCILKEPSAFLGDFMRNYRQLPESERDGTVETLLFTADRMHLCKTTVAPLLAQPGNVVISDRSYISTCAYQSLQGVPLEKILELNAFYPRPDLALIFLCNAQEAVRRIGERSSTTGRQISLDENIQKIAGVKSQFERVANQIPNTRIVKTDGSVLAVRYQIHSHLKGMMGEMMEKAVFLDKDGTLVENSAYERGGIPTDDILRGDTLEGMRALTRAGYRLIIVSNQPWIVKGRMTEQQVVEVFESVVCQYQKLGVAIDGYYFCKHQTTDGCECKKPKTKLLEQAVDEHNIDLSRSYFVGDMDSDIIAGRNMGMTTCLVKTGLGTKYSSEVKPDFVADNVNAFAKMVLLREEI